MRLKKRKITKIFKTVFLLTTFLSTATFTTTSCSGLLFQKSISIVGPNNLSEEIGMGGKQYYSAIINQNENAHVNWKLSSKINGINIDNLTGLLEWDSLLEVGIHKFDIIASSYQKMNRFEVVLEILPISLNSYVSYIDGLEEKQISLVHSDIDKLCTTNTFSRFEYEFYNGTVARDKLTGIVFGQDFLSITSLADKNDFLRFLFWYSDLTYIDVDLRGLNRVEKIGDGFAMYMFYNCSQLTSLPNYFNLPRKINIVGEKFATSMFSHCKNLISLPNNFNLPQDISGLVNTDFTRSMFSHCESLTLLPDNFNIPQKITRSEGWFATSMFSNCISLKYLPDNFNIPQGITEVGELFVYGLFQSCYSLQYLPNGFSLPETIDSIGDNFAAWMFRYCTSLQYLPESFKLPQNITSVGTNFVSEMFACCSNLKYDGLSTNPLIFPSPQTYGTQFGYNCFRQATALINAVSPPLSINALPGDEIKIARR